MLPAGGQQPPHQPPAQRAAGRAVPVTAGAVMPLCPLVPGAALGVPCPRRRHRPRVAGPAAQAVIKPVRMGPG